MEGTHSRSEFIRPPADMSEKGHERSTWQARETKKITACSQKQSRSYRRNILQHRSWVCIRNTLKPLFQNVRSPALLELGFNEPHTRFYSICKGEQKFTFALPLMFHFEEKVSARNTRSTRVWRMPCITTIRVWGYSGQVVPVWDVFIETV